ncbi:MAG: RNA methyltransferase [Muribaculaceae bacterium]|nr:RNA methyltransferase [Muribaculaceae bacterium]
MTLKKNVLELRRDTVESFHAKRKFPLTVVLDNVRSLNNIGSIFRTSDAFAVERILLCGITATPPSSEIHKTALGAEDSVNWAYFPTTLEALDSLPPDTVLCAVEQAHGSIPLQDFPIDTARSYAIVFGHEVHGVDQAVVDRCHHCIELPQFGTKHSLNVAVTAGITIWQFTLPHFHFLTT